MQPQQSPPQSWDKGSSGRLRGRPQMLHSDVSRVMTVSSACLAWKLQNWAGSCCSRSVVHWIQSRKQIKLHQLVPGRVGLLLHCPRSTEHGSSFLPEGIPLPHSHLYHCSSLLIYPQGGTLQEGSHHGLPAAVRYPLG